MVDKLIQRKAGKFQQYTPVTQSAGSADAGKLPALNSSGKLDSTLMPDGIGAATRTATASEALTAGAFVNEYLNSSALGVRLADNSNSRPATGFVKSAVTSGATATIWPLDSTNDQLSSGSEWGARRPQTRSSQGYQPDARKQQKSRPRRDGSS